MLVRTLGRVLDHETELLNLLDGQVRRCSGARCRLVGGVDLGVIESLCGPIGFFQKCTEMAHPDL